MKPKRIQRKRTKGWRMPIGAVYVGRPTIWGNPYKVGFGCTAQQAVQRFIDMLDGNIWTSPTKKEVRRDLRGRDLVCWCPLDKPCHADVLLEIANV